MPKKNKIFEELNRIAPLMPIPVYWLDINYVIVGANNLCLEAIGTNAKTVEAFIGKTYYYYYPKEIADELTQMIKIVLKTNKATTVEEKIVDVTTGKFRYYETVRAPLFDDEGNVVGTICTAIEVTEKKEVELQKLENERLKLENEKHEALAQERQSADELVRNIQASVANFLNKDSSKAQSIALKPEIKLTSREANVLYALYHKKNAKSAANYLSKKLNKTFTNDSVNTVVSRCLYPKFEVNSIDELINKAILLKMIPLFFPEKKGNKQ